LTALLDDGTAHRLARSAVCMTPDAVLVRVFVRDGLATCKHPMPT
jgi:hypothetical protein